MKICTVPDCGLPHDARGFCKRHLRSWYRYGDPLKTTNVRRGAHVAFAEQALQHNSDACLLWPYGRTTAGYGAVLGRTAPNFICEKAHGPAPEGRRYSLHSCHNALCVNPRHLRWGTQAENMRDKMLAGRSKKPWAIGKPRGTKKPTAKPLISHINPPSS